MLPIVCDGVMVTEINCLKSPVPPQDSSLDLRSLTSGMLEMNSASNKTSIPWHDTQFTSPNHNDIHSCPFPQDLLTLDLHSPLVLFAPPLLPDTSILDLHPDQPLVEIFMQNLLENILKCIFILHYV
ncbi:hypothetical protein HMI54_013747 [Coelomomyces lativittatus]|nr:hypothetical protein HMI54_013747 [Coelomomyces lativittatus]KAJ1502483.1 hypothetical protein HMI56_002663 [Coelomomyces lativittatus]